jgi:multidrug efflux pump subunit AcrA (membrane-fusion protein)
MTDAKQRPWHLYTLGSAAVLVIVLAITEIGAPSSAARASTEIVTAEKGVVQSTVSGSGNVEAGVDLDLNFQTSGTLKHVYVKEGQHVTKGQLLAKLDRTSAQLTLDQAEKNLTSAEDDLTSAEDGGSGSSTETSLKTGAGSGSADTEFVSYDPGSGGVAPTDPTTTTTASTTTTTATTTTTTMSTPSFPTTTTTSTQTTPTRTGGFPTTTTSETTTPSSGSEPSESGGISGSGGTGSGSTGSSSTSSAGSVASAEASIDSATASVDSAKQALADTKLYAPISGTIVSLSSLEPGDSVTSGSTTANSSTTGSSSSSSDTGTGTSATAGSLDSTSSDTSSSTSSTFAEIVNTHSLAMTVAFSESDISKIKMGQAATVTLDALTGVELGAHVSAISTVGTTSSSVVSYDATLTLDQNDSQVKPGMSASASVITAQAEGVNVPTDAVTGTGSLATVNLMQNGKTSSHQVIVGLQGTSRTQILSGLKTGDQIMVKTTLPALGSSTSTSGTSSAGTLGGGTSRFGGGGLGGAGFGGAGVGGGGFPGVP